MLKMTKWTMIRISREAKEELNKCKEEYLAHHPEVLGFRISDDRIQKIICKYYLEN
jgi:hypothetical protein